MEAALDAARKHRATKTQSSLSALVRREWPELYNIHRRLLLGKPLASYDREWVQEVARASGWSVEDVEEELRSLDESPRTRAERYRRLLEKYLAEADKLYQKGDYIQAGEKLWGATTALVKLYAALRGIPVIHWSRGRIDRFIENNVPGNLRDKFYRLVDTASRLHENFYEANMPPEAFRYRYKLVRSIIEELVKALKRGSAQQAGSRLCTWPLEVNEQESSDDHHYPEARLLVL